VNTKEGSVLDDDSYLGYSVAVGDFGDGDGSGAAVGMPRGAGLLGKVRFSTSFPKILRFITLFYVCVDIGRFSETFQEQMEILGPSSHS
jgi:hypothetical protein